MTFIRPDWDSYFMMIAAVAATRGTCLRRKVGAVIVRDLQIISTGYNGAPKGLPHCSEVGCLRDKLGIPSGERHEICRGSHAEINAIAQAAAVGTRTEGAVLYCTHEPCSFCTKAIINAGIRRIVFVYPYPDALASEMRSQASLEVCQLSEKVFQEMDLALKAFLQQRG
ncbi:MULTISPECIES: deoxycytidylate deaminase [Aminobacterium]|mgnify:FL=1|jgi:dCMP deaminase|uniref:CMP/dCMP deaminase zinc-binding protein n=1 Tax=Aminobacterium colombiense (strain DSM 12261 / ALA-1) TaxID=572547 RepID=D5EDB6_AMICL|nr:MULTISPECIES: dCMP deaminase family protein [Aminobacterium]MDD2379070.1 dCMP deaminase family protein [Aminobacterium colombiense]ADE56548.1 CMP/dCMP deaminase zinc-binding protein [Aminobacterium colombiense DSM 12261]MDD3768008.1 dCMP deaminase family protein [Aminobacterium colombiense]MDD4265244.1 dCMP deaminase family protein [Aminobacterium colombiense]MDD4585750.1 dCMP deaminase family protein [Aminobacterium colombiense]